MILLRTHVRYRCHWIWRWLPASVAKGLPHIIAGSVAALSCVAVGGVVWWTPPPIPALPIVPVPVMEGVPTVATAVPEPASWAVFVLALGALGIIKMTRHVLTPAERTRGTVRKIMRPRKQKYTDAMRAAADAERRRQIAAAIAEAPTAPLFRWWPE